MTWERAFIEELEKIASSRLRAATSIAKVPGGYDMKLGGNVIGTMRIYPDGRISSSGISKKYQGMGLGKKMYGEVLRRQPNLRSGEAVSGQAAGVWEGMKRRGGYSVKTHPKAKIGRWTAEDLKGKWKALAPPGTRPGTLTEAWSPSGTSVYEASLPPAARRR